MMAEEYKLTAAQIAPVLALAEKRDRIMGEIQAGFDALAQAYAAGAGLEPGTYGFDARPDGVYLMPKSARDNAENL